MARKLIHSLVGEHREARKILAELGALLGSTEPDDSELDTMSIATKTVRELAVEISNTTRIFEKLGIDYCCGGQRSLAEACATANISIDEVVRTLEQSLAEKVPKSDMTVR